MSGAVRLRRESSHLEAPWKDEAVGLSVSTDDWVLIPAIPMRVSLKFPFQKNSQETRHTAIRQYARIRENAEKELVLAVLHG